MAAKKNLVCISGWSAPKSIFQELSNKLAPYYNITLLDLPLIGTNINNIQCPEEYTLENVSRILLTQMPPQTSLLGWSLGGMLAQHLASNEPQAITKLITIATNLKFVQDSSWSYGMPQETFTQFQKLLAVNKDKCLLRFISLMLLRSKEVQKKRNLIEDLYQTNHQDIATLTASLNLLAAIDLRHTINLSQAQLHLYGKNDSLVPHNVANYYPKNIRTKPRVVTLAGCSHILFIDKLEVVSKLIHEFLRA